MKINEFITSVDPSTKGLTLEQFNELAKIEGHDFTITQANLDAHLNRYEGKAEIEITQTFTVTRSIKIQAEDAIDYVTPGNEDPRWTIINHRLDNETVTVL